MMTWAKATARGALTLILLSSLTVSASEALRAGAVQSETNKVEATALFCAYGSLGLRPNQLPADFETEFAIAVLEIRSPREVPNFTVSELTVTNQEGKVTKSKRVVQIEEFVRVRGSEADLAYYLSTEGARPWNGTLPRGTIRLRVRVALPEDPQLPVRFRLLAGDTVVEGRVNGMWAS